MVPMPLSVIKLAGVATDLNADIEEITEIIEFDQALTADLLRMANSVWGKTANPITTVKEVVVRLGPNRILQFAIGVKMSGPMSTAIPGYSLGENALWRHSLAAALAAESLNSLLHNPVPRLAFTAALLHDIGKLLLGRHLPSESTRELHQLMCESNISFMDAERWMLGTDHSEVGGSIARHWNLPKPLVDAIELHHEPDKEPSALLDVVHLSDVLARRIISNGDNRPMNKDINANTIQRLGVSFDDMVRICDKVSDELEEVKKTYAA
jgi:putative nucleotidyltransferase with HDIG domain